MVRATILVALAALCGCRQASPADVGEQSIRDAHPLATMQASERAAAVLPNVVPEAAKGGALEQPPSRIDR